MYLDEYNSPHNEKLIKSSEFPMEESKLDNSQKSEEYDIIKTISAKRTYSDLMKFSSIEINENINKINKTCLEKNIEKEIEGFPKYLGGSVIKGYALKNFNAASLKIGDELYLKRERKILIDEKKLKKKEKKNINLNKGFNDNIIRILTKNQEVFFFYSIFLTMNKNYYFFANFLFSPRLEKSKMNTQKY